MILVAIVSADGFISRDRGVPWDLPRDKARFRAVTAGQWLLLGRTTYEEMLGWFRDHRPLVMTRDKTFTAPVGQAVGSVEEALDIAQAGGARELFVLGGGQVFAAAMPWADRLLITHVDATLGAGVPFPPIPQDQWTAVKRADHPADAENSLPMIFVTYIRSGQKKPERR